MQHTRSLRKIPLIAGFTLVILGALVTGCVTGKPVSGENQAANENFGLSADAAPQGILLTFSNIPHDTTHMWIQTITWDTSEELMHRNYHVAYAGITDAFTEGWVHSTPMLEKVKQTGQVIFPFVETGKNYYISAMVYNQQEYRQMKDSWEPRHAETECIAGNGIYFNRGFVKLDLATDNTAVTLSSEPVFSSEVLFDVQKYTYSVTIFVSETNSVGVGDHHIPGGLSPDGLSWTFEPQMTTVNLKEVDSLESGNHYPAWSEAFANIVYDDILWSVEIAKTPEFSYSM